MSASLQSILVRLSPSNFPIVCGRSTSRTTGIPCGLCLPPPPADPSHSPDAKSILRGPRGRSRAWRVLSCRAVTAGDMKAWSLSGPSRDAFVFGMRSPRDIYRCGGIGCLHRRRIPTQNAVEYGMPGDSARLQTKPRFLTNAKPAPKRPREKSLSARDVEYPLVLHISQHAKQIRLDDLLVIGVIGFRDMLMVPIRHVPPRGFRFRLCRRRLPFLHFTAHISMMASSSGKCGTAA